jgi:hypothetical protein
MVYTETKTYIHSKEERKVLADVAREYRHRKKLAKATGADPVKNQTPIADARPDGDAPL